MKIRAEINEVENRKTVEKTNNKRKSWLIIKKEILSYVTTCMNLEDIVLSDMIQSQENKYCMMPLT